MLHKGAADNALYSFTDAFVISSKMSEDERVRRTNDFDPFIS